MSLNSVNTNMGALGSTKEQPGDATGPISATMIAIRNVMAKLADNAVQGDERSQYTAQYNSLRASRKPRIQDAGHDGETLAGGITGPNGIVAADVLIARMDELGTEMNSYGAALKYVDNQIDCNKNKISDLNGDLGVLIDADMAKELVQLQALRIHQHLSVPALSIANQAPQTLLSLFK